MPDAARFVAVPAVVADHLNAFIRDVLGYRRDEVCGLEDFKVTVDFGVEARAVDEGVCRGFNGHFFNGKRVAQDVLGQALKVSLGFGRDALAVVDIEAAVPPRIENLNPLRWKQFGFDEVVDDFGAE